ncbi:MAG: T9SS type A sorting domain-containing protein [Calditrichaeota bacterium]|nr:T9SS type A sorting domain-containing protein [Calditrichota bacterium]
MPRSDFSKLALTLLLGAGLFAPAGAGRGQSLEGISICVDPGHGPGNQNQGPTGLHEHTINLQVALKLRDYLKAFRADTVILTRVHTNPTLSQREDIANRAGVDWFHSIHHNAEHGSARYTLLLYEELANHRPQWPGQADVMSHIMAAEIYHALRTESSRVYGDYTFYGIPSRLGVLNDLTMPGELSEATFFDHPVEERKLRNQGFLQLEAKALLQSFLQYYEQDPPATGALAGIVSDMDAGRPLNGASVRVTPLDTTLVTDQYGNGLYVLADLDPGLYEVMAVDSLHEPARDTVRVSRGKFAFLDFRLVPVTPPTVQIAYPEDGAQNVPVQTSLAVRFSRPMDPLSVEQGLTLDPPVRGRWKWSDDSRQVVFTPRTRFAFDTEYRLLLTEVCTDRYGHPLDGDADGQPGGDFEVRFRTEPLDTTSLAVIDFEPAREDTGVVPGHVVWVLFNKRLNPEVVNDDAVLLMSHRRIRVPVSVHYSEQTIDSSRGFVGGRLAVFPLRDLEAGMGYKVAVMKTLSDLTGGQLANYFRWDFYASSRPLYPVTLDDFSADTLAWSLDVEGDSSAVNPDSTVLELATGAAYGDSAYGLLRYRFDAPSSVLLMNREKPAAWLPEKVARGEVLTIAVRGDQSGNVLRFVFRDFDGEEFSPASVVDWTGWKSVEVTVGEDLVPGQGGNGRADADSLLFLGLRLEQTGSLAGELGFDRLVLLARSPATAVLWHDRERRADAPKEFKLAPNWPNPFRNATEIKFWIGPGAVGREGVLEVINLLGQQVATLWRGQTTEGWHRFTWDGRDGSGQDLPSGIYFARLTVGGQVQIGRLVLLR